MGDASMYRPEEPGAMSQDNGDHNGDGQWGAKYSILRVRYVTSGGYACVIVRMLWKE
jgi:hypothetical protein